MMIYFHSNNPDSKDAKQVIEYLKKLGIDLAMAKNQLASLAEVDALLVQGDALDTNANYFIALAIAENKPVLCLLSKKINDQTVVALETNKNFQNKVKLVFYKEEDLTDNIITFLRELDAQAGQEVANIKYTLRINQKISNYLNWKIGNAKRKKANWLRDKLQLMMEQDQGYQKYLQDKFKIK